MKEVPVKKKVAGSNAYSETMVWKIIGHALVDDKHYPGLIQYNWTSDKDGYVQRFEWNGSTKINKLIRMETDIWCRLEGLQRTKLDHIDRDPRNNQMNNFRPANSSQNGANRGLFINNTTGFKGVSWRKSRKCYRALIKVNGKLLELGHFSTALEAAKSYDAAAIKYFGEFALTNKALGLY